MKQLRAWVAALLCLSLVPMHAVAEAEATERVVLALSASAVLLSAEGETIVDRDVYTAIDRLELGDRTLYAAYTREGGVSRCAIMDGDGQMMTDARFGAVTAADGVLYVEEDGLLGVMNAEMEKLVPCEYTQIVTNHEGGFLAINSDPYDSRADGVYHIGANGEETATGVKVMYGLCDFSSGLMPVVSDNGRTGYLNADGNWAISAQYDYAGEFHGDVAEAVISTGAGFIGRDGNWLVTPKYEIAEIGGADGTMMLAQADNTEVLLLDADTFEVRKRFTGDDIYVSAYFDNDLAVLYLDDCTQLIDANGDVVFEAGLDSDFDAWSVMGERIIVRQGEWGEKCMWLYLADGTCVAGPFREAWLLGAHEGRTLFAAADYSVTERPGAGDAPTDLVEVEGTRTIEVIDENGERVVAPQSCINLTMSGGVLVFETAHTMGIKDLSGATIAEFDKRAP